MTTEPDPNSAGRSQQEPEPSPAAVEEQLERILSSAEFAQSDRLKRFLRYIVEETLAGRGPMLKEYRIALDVFERAESFDPQTSSIVRVEASRLRAKLEKYNAIEGRGDSVRVHIPSGRYMPTFEVAQSDSGPSTIGSAGASAGRTRMLGSKRRLAFLAFAVAGLGIVSILLSEPALLRFWSEPPGEPGLSVNAMSVAVLPLRNLSSDQTDDYFSDGITDALITGLAKAGQLRVISMTSAMAYKNVNRSIAGIAKELGVSHVVEGSVQRAGDKVRITAQLIEAKGDRHLWAESYEGNFSEIFELQDNIARQVVATLTENLGTTQTVPQRLSTAVHAEAQEDYLRGRYFRNQMTEDVFSSEGVSAPFAKKISVSPSPS